MTDNPLEFRQEVNGWDYVMTMLKDKYPEASCVYFVERNNSIKIGMTGSLKHRMDSYDTASDIEPHLRLIIPTENRHQAEDLERYCHKVWIGKSLRGEWFDNKFEQGNILDDFAAALWQRGEQYYKTMEATA